VDSKAECDQLNLAHCAFCFICSSVSLAFISLQKIIFLKIVLPQGNRAKPKLFFSV